MGFRIQAFFYIKSNAKRLFSMTWLSLFMTIPAVNNVAGITRTRDQYVNVTPTPQSGTFILIKYYAFCYETYVNVSLLQVDD